MRWRRRPEQTTEQTERDRLMAQIRKEVEQQLVMARTTRTDAEMELHELRRGDT